MQTRDQLLNNAIATADAMTALFGPRVEVVVHDLSEETISYIVNPLSHRGVGDPSNLEEIDFRPSDTVIGPYEKINWDGHLIRSISVVQRASDDSASFLICINYDQSDLQAAQRAIQVLLPAVQSGSQPEALFRKDWHERVNTFVTDWCNAREARVDALDKRSRRDLVLSLESSGALSEKHAAAYVARVLGVSRATIYNDLKKDVDG